MDSLKIEKVQYFMKCRAGLSSVSAVRHLGLLKLNC